MLIQHSKASGRYLGAFNKREENTASAVGTFEAGSLSFGLEEKPQCIVRWAREAQQVGQNELNICEAEHLLGFHFLHSAFG